MPEIELSAGTIEYEDTGGLGPIVVLLHGLVMDSSVWRVLPLDMVDKSISPLQTHFGPVFGDEAVQTGLLFPE